MHFLKNDLLEIAIHPIGAELQKINSAKTNLEFMWHGDPGIWSGFAPNLFPIVGELKEGFFIFEDKSYHLPRHGFARRSKAFTLENQTENTVVFKLSHSKETLTNYPFKFEFMVTYELNENQIRITYTVNNVDDKALYFSVGAHPAFKCPVFSDEDYEDYHLEFEHPETSSTHLLNLETGLLSSEMEPVFNTPTTITLHQQLFNKDALVFTNLKSKKVALKSKVHGEILNLTFTDFPYLGVWAKPQANYICIEPWQGIADHEKSSHLLKEKQGIVALARGKSYNASYTIEIDKRHLA